MLLLPSKDVLADHCAIRQSNGHPHMNMKRHGVVLAVIALSGCAQTVWVKPGASSQEHAAADFQCDYVASTATTRQPVYGYRASTVIASAIVAGIAEGLEQASWKAKCMQANGFVRVPVPAAGTVVVAAPAPVAESPVMVTAQLIKPVEAAITSQTQPVATYAASPNPVRPIVSHAKCTAYSYQEYLQQKRICDADTGGS